ncbi:MAG: hypothetical protein ACXVDD_00885 [Polyangia bacterium]
MLRAALVVATTVAWSGGVVAGETDAREPPVAAAIGTGGGVAFVTMLAGSLLFGSTPDDGLHRTGVYVAMAGLTLAPAVAHLMVKEYKRAAIFSALPLAMLVVNTVVMQIDPQVTTLGSPETRVTLGVALTAAVLGATVGLVDLFGASDRWRARHPLMVAPAIVPGGGGASLGARF